MAEAIDNNRKAREEVLKQIIRELHAGTPVEELQNRFKKLIENTSPDEIADMENALISEGFPPEEIQRLCDVHAQVFEKSLRKSGRGGKIPGHPVHTFLAENKEAKSILKILTKNAIKFRKGRFKERDIEFFKEQFQVFSEIDKHYQRKENQLFPLLEAKQFSGPTQIMWGKHDEIREMLRTVSSIIEEEDWDALPGKVKKLSSAVKRLIFLEEKILFPTSLKKLNDAEWAQIKLGGPEIGYAWVTPSDLWDANLAKLRQPDKKEEKERITESGMAEESIPLSQGHLTVEQIDLMLKNLPVDITFVDENDRVCYYSDTKERIFPRSPAIIGRAVQNCHPPKSVHVVEKILKNFREKTKDSAEFWIQMGDKFIYIRYFPVYDRHGRYRGVIEVSQEITKIRALKGERRLLDW
jgi:DUF438 domain-containing protein